MRSCAAQPGRLVEEAQALCLLGGRRLVRVREAGDLATDAVHDLLALPSQAGFVVLEAGELPGSSSLRKLIEAAPTAMALPCYRDEADKLGGLVRSLLAEHRAERGARGARLPATPSRRRPRRSRAPRSRSSPSTMADRPGARVTLADAAAVVGDSSALGIEDAVDAGPARPPP